ncbi:MAG: hypothetical protein E7614_09125 [Ruminococcaceae bacterium]|nr:hypothetical protein [Oscillospiraceae bacterium]
MNVDGTNVDIYSDIGASSSKFVIERVKTGTYQGLYLIRYGNQYLAHNTSNNNVYVTSSKSAAAYWSFMAVEKRSAEFFCHDYWYTDEENIQRHFDSSLNYDYFETTFDSLNYDAISYENKRAAILYESLGENDDIFVFMGHGTNGAIFSTTTRDIATGCILANSNMNYYIVYSYYISNFDENQLALNRCVLYLGCSTGLDYTNSQGTYNLVDATFEKGAHFVLGTTETIYDIQGNPWLEYFLDSINEGSTIQEAIAYANWSLGNVQIPCGKDENGDTIYRTVYGLPIYSVGDGTQYLNIE